MPFRRTLSARIALVAALLGLGLVIALAATVVRQRTATPGGIGPSPSASRLGCPLPAERPAYLPPGFRPDPVVLSTAPGTGPGQAVPTEDRQRALVWEGTNGEYLTFWAEDADELLDSPLWERATVRGRTGIFVWIGDPFVGPVHVIWRERSGRCGIYRLGARLRQVAGAPAADPGQVARALQREAARIAESLG